MTCLHEAIPEDSSRGLLDRFPLLLDSRLYTCHEDATAHGVHTCQGRADLVLLEAAFTRYTNNNIDVIMTKSILQGGKGNTHLDVVVCAADCLSRSYHDDLSLFCC